MELRFLSNKMRIETTKRREISNVKKMKDKNAFVFEGLCLTIDQIIIIIETWVD